MNRATAVAIVEAANEFGAEIFHREGYSGRGMMGEGTDAIVYDSQSDFLQAVALAAVNMGDSGDGGLNLDDFLVDLGSLRFDSMGRRSSVVY